MLNFRRLAVMADAPVERVSAVSDPASPQDCNRRTANGCKSARRQSRNITRPYQTNRCAMSIIGWIILGLIAGFISSKLVNKTGEGFFLDIVLGIVGAMAGGFLFGALGIGGITGLNLYGMVVAVVGAIVVLLGYHAIRRTV
jgi:uncharacterized membrane protein YeaQ/YmgE (transglycosylase-associated protein family)